MYYKGVKSDNEKITGLPLSINIFIRLREDILHGKLKTGEKLTENRICSEYNVSRTPVREAFRLLEQEDLIQTIPNRGAFVMGFSQQDIADMYDMRREYEILAFRWAVSRMTEEELERIRYEYDLMEFYTGKGEHAKAADHNMHFHELIYEASHNRMLIRILTSYQYYSRLLKEGVEENPDDAEPMDELLEEHYEILRALEDRDIKRGTAAVNSHLERSKKRAVGEFQE